MDYALRQLGELDAIAGKPISAFYDIPNIDPSDEAARAEYEKGYWGKAVELRNEGH